MKVRFALDIEMAMAMAPGLAKIVVFESFNSDYVNDILDAMVTNTTISQFSCSWHLGWRTFRNHRKSFPNHAGAGSSRFFMPRRADSDAYAAGSANDINNHAQAHYPTFSVNITQVGGTVLTHERKWRLLRLGNGLEQMALQMPTTAVIPAPAAVLTPPMPSPPGSKALNMTINLGSTNAHNIPDVAMVATNIVCLRAHIRCGGCRDEAGANLHRGHDAHACGLLVSRQWRP